MIRMQKEQNCSNALIVLNDIPEFAVTFNKNNIDERLNNSGIILVAYHDKKPVACKIAYNRFNNGSLYSWLGGVLPEYRRRGIATLLNSELEKIAKESYQSIVFKTRNKFKPMIHFGLKNGYEIIGFEEKQNINEHRIILKKKL